jgi:hypothetical protein
MKMLSDSVVFVNRLKFGGEGSQDGINDPPTLFLKLFCFGY